MCSDDTQRKRKCQTSQPFASHWGNLMNGSKNVKKKSDRESSPGITWASTTFRDAGLASWTYGGIRPWLNIAIYIFKLHLQQKLQSKDDNVDPHSGYTSCRNSKDPKKKESLHLSGPPLLPPGHVRRQPKKVWQSTQYLVVIVNNDNMMFSLQAMILLLRIAGPSGCCGEEGTGHHGKEESGHPSNNKH